jgi:large subunit ribosomal protein L25
MARELSATVREKKGSHAVRKLRQQSFVPAVIYREGKPGTNLSIPENEWKKVLASGERVVTLKLSGGDKQALIKDVQYGPLGDETLHVDFSELREGEKVRVAVALTLKGVPKGHVKGGILHQPVHTLHVECLPTQIPDRVIFNAEPLDIDDAVHVRDIKLPEGVTALDSPDIVVAAVHMPRVEEAAAPAEGAALEPEVIGAKPAEGEAASEGGAVAGGPKPAEKKEEKKDEKKK